MLISIASGKGGTGKTTVATNLALSIGSGVRLLDCDVEEPNSHLFLKPKIDEKIEAFTPVPKIDKEKCTLCKKCAEICRFKAITVIADTVLTFPEMCHGCGGCLHVCPENAITEEGRKLGIVEKGKVNGIEFVHGVLRINEAMSPPLIRETLKFVDSDKINIVDAPPGTSCPVIAATKDADFVLLVTEPTPFGLHDLKLAVEAVKILKIPCGIVINRSDMGDDKTKKYAVSQNIPVLMEIPFDRKIAEIYSKGENIVDVLPHWKEKFFELYQTIKKLGEDVS